MGQLNLPIAATDITMLSRRIATARPLRNAIPIVRRAALNQQRGVAQAGPEYPKLTDVEDPGMNGGYINPPPVNDNFVILMQIGGTSKSAETMESLFTKTMIS